MRELVSGEIEFVSGGDAMKIQEPSGTNIGGSGGGGVCISSNPWGTNAMPPQDALHLNTSQGASNMACLIDTGAVLFGAATTADVVSGGLTALALRQLYVDKCSF
jgi:hypothetical protein